MQTPAERARKDALREWLRTAYVGLDRRPILNLAPYAIGISKEAFVAGWNARDQHASDDENVQQVR